MKNLILSVVVTFAACSAFAEPPAKIDVSKLPQQSRMVDEVVVPVPSEIFGVLDKLGKPRWTEVLRKSEDVAEPFGEQVQIALYLGTVIAEGFIAVEAEDADQVKRIGRSVIALSKPLGVSQDVKTRANAIIEAGDKKDWGAVRRELDGALNEVKSAMAKLDSQQLAELVSLGGWLRGTEALTDVVEKDYTKESAELLHQKVLLDYFVQRIEVLKPKFRQHTLVQKILKGLNNISPLIGLSDGTDVSEKSVKEVGDITADLVKTIQTK